MRDNEIEKSILSRLDVLVLIALEQSDAPGTSVTQKIERLSAYGLPAAEIATILRKPTNYVTALMSQSRRRRGKGTRTNG